MRPSSFVRRQRTPRFMVRSRLDESGVTPWLFPRAFMPIRQLSLVPDKQLQDEFATQEFVLLYKHSPLCGLCDIAIAEVNAFVEANPDVPVWLVDVISQRPMSQRLAAMLDVEHESPQVIMVRRGASVWDGSHRRVTRARLEEAMAATSGQS